jgi:hypothetical protein
MKTAVKAPESAVYRRGLGIFLTETPLSSPFPPQPLFSPPSGPSHWLFQELLAISNFLQLQPMEALTRLLRLKACGINCLAAKVLLFQPA